MHAYLLMIHENTLVLQTLLKLLDDEQNDIYIHADKKASDLDLRSVRKPVKKSRVFFTKRYRVYWGSGSMVKAELALLRAASSSDVEYEYCHLLSGADLPLKSQKEIHAFFARYQGKEFVHLGSGQYQRDIRSRYDKYHFFTKQLGRKRDKKLWTALETYSLAIQRRLRIDRAEKLDFAVAGGQTGLA